MFVELCRIEKQFASLNIINSEEAIKVLDLLEKNIEKRDTLITNLKTEIATPELLEKGVIIIHKDGCLEKEKKDYVYSFKEKKILSQGFDKIEVEEIIGDKKINYVKDWGCLKATCVVSSNIDEERNITNELIGKLNLEGNLMECMFNINTGTIYNIWESNNIDKLIKKVQKELNTQVIEEKERKEKAEKIYQKIFPINPQE